MTAAPQRPNPVAPPGRVCGTCRHWRSTITQYFGECMMIAEVLAIESEELELTTPQTFGCSEWQAKAVKE